jgi:EmrB/QacA subfamily drug resistance transporter
VNTASLDPANRPTATRRIDFRPGQDMYWEIVRNGEDTDGEVLEANSWLGPHSPSPPVHVHDNAEDSFEIVEGRLDVKLDGTWRTFGPGERAAAAPGHRHTLRNTHDEPVRFINRHRPAADYEAFFRDMASLASTGKMGSGTPHSPRQADLRSDAVPSSPDRDPHLAPAAIRIRIAVGLGPDAGDEPMSAHTPRTKNLALLLLAMTQFVIVIDASIVNVALPSIGAHLHFSRDNLTWVVNAYTLTFGGFLLLGGRMADLLGRRRMFMLGLVVFSLASLAGGLAQSETWLIAARAVQGLGAAIVSPAALSIITTTFADGAERNRALGMWGAVAGAGGAAGVLLGGILTSGLSWRWVLFVNVPIGLLAAALAPRTLGESRREDAGNSFDIPGAVAVTGGLALLVYAVVDAVNVGWGATRTIVCLAAAVVLLIAFVAIELRQHDPLMPFAIFRLRTLRGANIVGLLIGMSLFSMFFFISLYLQDVLHYSPIRTGISYLPLAVGIIISAGLASQLVTRIGFKPTLVAGLLLVAGGLLWFSQVPGTGGSFAAYVLGPSLLAAFGFGLAFVPVTIAAVTATKPHEAGLASGLINTSQQIGGALGLAILATIANSHTQSLYHAGVHSTAVALTKGYDRAFLVGAGPALAGAILAAALISTRDSHDHSVTARSGDPAPAAAAG